MGAPAVTITPDITPDSGVTITPDSPPAQPGAPSIMETRPRPGIEDVIPGVAVAKQLGDPAVRSTLADELKAVPSGIAQGFKAMVQTNPASELNDSVRAVIDKLQGREPQPGMGDAVATAAKFYAGNQQNKMTDALSVAPEAIGNATGNVVAGELPGATIGAVKNIANAIPSTARAGETFQDVAKAANKVPIDFSNSQDAVLKMVDWQKKTQLGPTINKFLNRVTNPNLGPVTYGEARDFYQLLGRLSADETSRMAPAVRFDLTRMVRGLKTDIGNAAGVVGQQAPYYQAMEEFRNAKRLEDISDATKDIVWTALKRAAQGSLALYGGKKLWDALP